MTQLQRDLWRIDLARRGEKALTWLAWHLPPTLVMWCYIRLVAHATTGDFGNTNPNELGVMDALRRWDSPRGGDARRF